MAAHVTGSKETELPSLADVDLPCGTRAFMVIRRAKPPRAQTLHGQLAWVVGAGSCAGSALA